MDDVSPLSIGGLLEAQSVSLGDTSSRYNRRSVFADRSHLPINSHIDRAGDDIFFSIRAIDDNVGKKDRFGSGATTGVVVAQ